jgi:putative spermidine/putrescine transport system permease protein
VLALALLPLLYVVGLGGTLTALVLCHGLLGLPVVYLILQDHVSQLSPELEIAARGLGATAWQAAMRVTFPLLQPALLAGAAAAFVGSLNEAMLTLFLTTPFTETLPAVVWPQLHYAPSPLVAVASCVCILSTLGGVGGLILLFRGRAW